jgi:hypothetical protein
MTSSWRPWSFSSGVSIVSTGRRLPTSAFRVRFDASITTTGELAHHFEPDEDFGHRDKQVGRGPHGIHDKGGQPSGSQCRRYLVLCPSVPGACVLDDVRRQHCDLQGLHLQRIAPSPFFRKSVKESSPQTIPNAPPLPSFDIVVVTSRGGQRTPSM